MVKAVGRMQNYLQRSGWCYFQLVSGILVGRLTETNAHPHRSETGRFVLVHNGVIENYLGIKEELLQVHHFKGTNGY